VVWEGEPRLVRVAVAAAFLISCAGDDPRKDDGGDSIASISATETDSGIGEDDHQPEKLDSGTPTDGGGGPGDCGSGGGQGGSGNDFSLIWIANSPQGTVSKIDTKTGVELARYYTGPGNGNDDPSRTSVNLGGDVAVTNRSGSVTKIAAELERCVDQDGDGVIQTSSGPNDVLPWGADECVLWHRHLTDVQGDNTRGPRPTAWDVGTDGNPCNVGQHRLWVGWYEVGPNQAHFQRLTGATGNVEADVIVPNWNPSNPNYGPYGGGVDRDGNLWVIGLFGILVRIDAVTLDWQRWEFPSGAQPYGIAIDGHGHPWTGGWNGELVHFDPTTEQFELFANTGASRLRGVQIDRDNQLWAATNAPCGLLQFDLSTRTVVNPGIGLPGCGTPVGVSIDDEGYVWVPDQSANRAFKVHPTTYETQTTEGLVNPYTYSDMTGAGLGLVTIPPPA
jgi:hypothetical protein